MAWEQRFYGLQAPVRGAAPPWLRAAPNGYPRAPVSAHEQAPEHPHARLSPPGASRAVLAACALLALLATLGLSAPSVRAEVSNPFPGVTTESESEAEAEEAARAAEETAGGTESTEASGTSDSILFIAGGIALVLVLVIGYVIVRDARSSAPTEDPYVQEERSSHDRAVALRKRRAKAKRARRQRKYNRSS